MTTLIGWYAQSWGNSALNRSRSHDKPGYCFKHVTYGYIHQHTYLGPRHPILDHHVLQFAGLKHGIGIHFIYRTLGWRDLNTQWSKFSLSIINSTSYTSYTHTHTHTHTNVYIRTHTHAHTHRYIPTRTSRNWWNVYSDERDLQFLTPAGMSVEKGWQRAQMQYRWPNLRAQQWNKCK